MNHNIVEDYTWNILRKQLQKFRIPNNILYKILDNVKEQLLSFISVYDEVEFRNMLLILGSEEGNFYEPKNDLIANMVVVTIRNSLLEEVCSINHSHYGTKICLDGDYVKTITSKAIEFFEQKDLDESSKDKVNPSFYKEVASNYPVACRALLELSKCDSLNREHSYEEVKIKEPYYLKELDNVGTVDMNSKNYESGISPEFNDSLCNFLIGIRDKKSKIYMTDSFKMTTRNFEKTLKIIEFVLTHDGIYMTCNYLMTKNYVSRRKEILKASHDFDGMYSKLETLYEISDKYSLELKNIQELAKDDFE